MTEYEAASLAVQQAALAAQQAAIWVAAAVGAAQCSLIGVGLYIMRRASIQRDAMLQETMKALDSQHRETMASLESRHRKTMKALENQNNAMMELIRRTSAPSAQGDG
ncbi:MAG: hypothetical protein OXG62_16555 [Nitrospinae bacterium]|nr:hypothetical protein [Nitrospinota bacterium]